MKEKSDVCSVCGLTAPLAKANISRKTKERLFRSWCVSCEKKRKDVWRAKNKEHHNLKSKLWVQKNPEKRKQISHNWNQRNKEITARFKATRKTRFRQSCPTWLTEFDVFYIEELYALAKLRKLEVDHIIPLQGKLVCGLHVPSNLQMLTRTENRSKGNKFEIN